MILQKIISVFSNFSMGKRLQNRMRANPAHQRDCSVSWSGFYFSILELFECWFNKQKEILSFFLQKYSKGQERNANSSSKREGVIFQNVATVLWKQEAHRHVEEKTRPNKQHIPGQEAHTCSSLSEIHEVLKEKEDQGPFAFDMESSSSPPKTVSGARQ